MIVCNIVTIALSPIIATKIAKKSAMRAVRKAFRAPTLPDLLRDKKLTKYAVARRLCVSLKDVRSWCKGNSIPDRKLRPAIASVFGLSENDMESVIVRTGCRYDTANRNRF